MREQIDGTKGHKVIFADMKTVRKNFEVALMADCTERRSACKSHNFKFYMTVFIYARHITKETDFARLGDKSVFIYVTTR